MVRGEVRVVLPNPHQGDIIPIACAKFTIARAAEDPLLKVPPARRGNRASVPLAVPLAKRGEPKGGGQFINSDRAIGISRDLLARILRQAGISREEWVEL